MGVKLGSKEVQFKTLVLLKGGSIKCPAKEDTVTHDMTQAPETSLTSPNISKKLFQQ